MARFEVRLSSGKPTTVLFYILDLQYPAKNYDRFYVEVYYKDIFQFEHSWTMKTNDHSASSSNSNFLPQTTYTFKAYAVYKNVRYYVGSDSITTGGKLDPPPNPSYITVYNITKTSCTLSWGLVPVADYYEVYINKRYYNKTTSTIMNITGLSQNTTYVLTVYAVNRGGSSSGISETVTTLSDRPSDWQWLYNIYSGGPFYAQNKKIAYLMPADHWNNFTNKINEFRRYKGLSNYNFTTVYSEQTVTSSIINQAISAINDMLPSRSKMPFISSGSEVKASIFIDMRNKLNSIT